MSREPVSEELMQRPKGLEDFPGKIRPGIFWFYSSFAVLTWTLTIIGSFMWNIQREQKSTRELAKREARANFNKDQAFRSWGASHGGVYVPVDEKTPPSPYMSHIPERDIKTPSGKLLTLMNPAYMIRQMMEDYSAQYGIKGHITSLKLLRPENAPDEWERKALESFEKGVDEVSEFTEIDGEPYLRLMRPMITKQECLKCHRYQGYKVGDVRGGVGISLPMKNLLNIQKETISILYISHGLILFLGLGGIWLGTKRIKQSMIKHYQAEEKLTEYRLHLEDLVKERTEELSRINDQLKKEISERKKIEDNLLREKGFSETAINSLPGIFYLLDENGKFLRRNKNHEKVTGYSDEEISKLIALDLVAQEDRENTAKRIQEVLEKGETTLEANLLIKNGKKIPYFFTGSLMDVGNKKYIVGMGIDLTERKRVEEELRVRQKEIEAINATLEVRVQEEVEKSRQKDYIMIKQSRLAAMGEMIRFITHQWGQPLWALQLLFHNIEDLIEDSEINQEDANELIANGFALIKKMFDTMSDFKNFFQVDKEKVTFSVNKNVKDTLSLLGANFKYSNVSIILNEKEELMVSGFPNEFSQVILNILNNSKDAIVEKGIKGEIKMDFLCKDDSAVVRIKDNGGGIPEDFLDKIFDSYFTTKKEGKGTGIGLYLSKMIIEERMNGRINVENTRKGVKFEIRLPLIRS